MILYFVIILQGKFLRKAFSEKVVNSKVRDLNQRYKVCLVKSLWHFGTLVETMHSTRQF